jgi:hypothetical protein
VSDNRCGPAALMLKGPKPKQLRPGALTSLTLDYTASTGTVNFRYTLLFRCGSHCAALQSCTYAQRAAA